MNRDHAFLDPKPKHFSQHHGVEKMPGAFTQLPPKLTSYKTQRNQQDRGSNGDTHRYPPQTVFIIGQLSSKVLLLLQDPIQRPTLHCVTTSPWSPPIWDSFTVCLCFS